MNDRVIRYEPSGTITKAFHESDAFFRGIMGPVGSGKSVACTIELMRRAQLQGIGTDGKRHFRAAIVRNSFPELRSTTIKTYAEWMPLSFGRFNQDSPITHHIKTNDIDFEFLFMALDKPDDARKLLSLEVTAIWFNEVREINKGIIDIATSRVGRYPGKNLGGCTWSGVIADTNPCDTDCWYYKMAEETRPNDWEFFRQPGGLSPDAENIENLPKNYYQRASTGKDDDWINVYVHGNYGMVNDGTAVFTSYRDQVHCADEDIQPIVNTPLLVSADFGLTPAAVIAQRLADGRWLILDELVLDDIGIVRFAEQLKSYITRNYANFLIAGAWGDPAGTQRAFSDERTALEIMTRYTGWRWRPAPTNSTEMRLEVVRNTLNRMVDGKPGILISSRCRMLRKGFGGGYCRKFIKSSGGTQTHEEPVKNEYSHPHDALQYLLLGGGESVVILRGTRKRNNGAPRMARDVDYDLFAN